METHNRNLVNSWSPSMFYVIFLGVNSLLCEPSLSWRSFCEGFPQRQLPAVMWHRTRLVTARPRARCGHLLTWRQERPALPRRRRERAARAPEVEAAWGHHFCPLGTGQIGTCPFSALSVLSGYPCPFPVPARLTPAPAALRRLEEGAARVLPLGAQPRERAALPGAGEKVPRSGSPGRSRWEESPPCPGRGGRPSRFPARSAGAGEPETRLARPWGSCRQLQVSNAVSPRHGSSRSFSEAPSPLRPRASVRPDEGSSVYPAEEHPPLHSGTCFEERCRVFILIFSTSDAVPTLCPFSCVLQARFGT